MLSALVTAISQGHIVEDPSQLHVINYFYEDGILGDFCQHFFASVSQIKNINTLRLRQDGCHFPDKKFKYIFLNENVSILTDIEVCS